MGHRGICSKSYAKRQVGRARTPPAGRRRSCRSPLSREGVSGDRSRSSIGCRATLLSLPPSWFISVELGAERRAGGSGNGGESTSVRRVGEREEDGRAREPQLYWCLLCQVCNERPVLIKAGRYSWRMRIQSTQGDQAPFRLCPGARRDFCLSIKFYESIELSTTTIKKLAIFLFGNLIG